MKWSKSALTVCLSIMFFVACNANSESIEAFSNAASSHATDASHEASVDFELRTGIDISWPMATYHEASPGFYQINFAEYEKFSFVLPLLNYRSCSSSVVEPPTSYTLKAYYIHEGQVTDSYISFTSTAFQSAIRNTYDAFSGDEFEILTDDHVRTFFFKKRTEGNRTQSVGYPSQGNITVEINFYSSYYEREEKILIENTFEFEDVNSILLEAGQANGTQYVLPLCFQIDGILLCDTSESNLRMEKDLENMSTMQFYSYIDDRYPEWRVQGQWHENLNNNMDAPVNFEDMNVDLFVHELPELLQREVDSLNTKGIYRIPDLNAYLKEGAIIDSPNGLPYIWGPVSRYLDYAAMTLINRTTPILIPIPNADGQIYARITGIAAISRNCKNTTASELLLTFLISDRWQKKGTDVGSTVLYGFPIKKSAMKSWFQDETLTYLDKLPCERLNGQTLESFIIWYDKIEGAYFSFRPKEIAQLIYTNAETEQRISVEELKKVEEILKRQLSE